MSHGCQTGDGRTNFGARRIYIRVKIDNWDYAVGEKLYGYHVNKIFILILYLGLLIVVNRRVTEKITF